MIAGREEVIAWLGHPVTKALGAELQSRLDDYRRQLPNYVVKGDGDKARSAAGAIKAYEEFMAEFFATPEDLPVEEPDNYRDPAARRSQEETT